ncbi:hypothetical protein [Methylobacterium sp. 37f]|uniref:hypothetical protein n=1 Tax=Methylobacterium sp. 37f TaxID=2817058 RepID=UPI001FFDA04C|nr:hypothetical protein [Methylobacterium sp. 37f]MCK2054769.1 hypothetical protein [Methylobacterium sp. 37f]
MYNSNDIEARLRAAGFDPLKVANFQRTEQHQQQMAVQSLITGQGVYPLEDEPVAAQGVYPLVTALTNENNVNNGYTPDGFAIGVVPEEHLAVAIEEEVTTNGLAPSFATQDDEPNNPALPSALEDSIGVEDDGARASIMPTPFYVKVDLFDNGAGKPGKKKSNQYKVKIHLVFEDGGDVFSYLGAFHPVARGFRNNVPEGYERDPFYVEIDHTLDKANLGQAKWHIKPVGAKFKDADNKVIIYTAAIVFWDVAEDNPTILLSLQGWNMEVTLDKRPAGGRVGNNLLAYGIWLNPEMKPEREEFENRKGGNTLMETIRLQQMGIKK